jgi:hypothetical protein
METSTSYQHQPQYYQFEPQTTFSTQPVFLGGRGLTAFLPQWTIEPVTFEFNGGNDNDEDFSISTEDLEFVHVMLCFVAVMFGLMIFVTIMAFIYAMTTVDDLP